MGPLLEEGNGALFTEGPPFHSSKISPLAYLASAFYFLGLILQELKFLQFKKIIISKYFNLVIPEKSIPQCGGNLDNAYFMQIAIETIYGITYDQIVTIFHASTLLFLVKSISCCCHWKANFFLSQHCNIHEINKKNYGNAVSMVILHV